MINITFTSFYTLLINKEIFIIFINRMFSTKEQAYLPLTFTIHLKKCQDQ